MASHEGTSIGAVGKNSEGIVTCAPGAIVEARPARRQQVKSLVQVIRWYGDGRVQLDDGHVTVSGATFDLSEFSPNLDFPDAIELEIPHVGSG